MDEINWGTLSDSDEEWEWYRPRGSMTQWTNNGLVCWLKEKGLKACIREVSDKKVNGRVLLSLINNGGLGTIGITSLVDITALLWAVEDLIKNKGDYKSGALLGPELFTDVPGTAARISAEAVKEFQSLYGLLQTKADPQPEKKISFRNLNLDHDSNKATLPPPPAAAKETKSQPEEAESAVDAQSDVFLAFLSTGEEITGNSTQVPSEAPAQAKEAERKEENLEEAIKSLHAVEYELVFFQRGTLHLILQQDGYLTRVKGFPKRDDGSMGFAESTGKIAVGDIVIGVNNISFKSFGFRDTVNCIKNATWPLILRLKREPPAASGAASYFQGFSNQQLRFVLLEAGVHVPRTMEGGELVRIALETFCKTGLPQKLPLAPAPHRTHGLVSSILVGSVVIQGWILMQAPLSLEHWNREGFTRCYGVLKGTDFFIHAPEQGNESQFEEEPDFKLSMHDVKLVEVTRSNEVGNKFLRIVTNDDQVWRMATEDDEYTKDWLSRLSLAQLVGPGRQTTRDHVPGNLVVLQKTSHSLTISWLPPAQRFLSSCRYFQLNYQKVLRNIIGATSISDAMECIALPGVFGASLTGGDEIHATTATIDGLQPDVEYMVMVRACHEMDNTLVWGDWSEPLIVKTEKHRYGPIWNPEHLWVLVSGRLGMPRDFDYFTAQLEGRFGARVKVLVSQKVVGLETHTGIENNAELLFSEVSPLIERVNSLKQLSFVGHDTGGLVARYCLKLLEERSSLQDVELMYFATFGTPHLGHMFGPIARFVTGVQLRLEDTEAGGIPTLIAMGKPEFTNPLRRFKRRICYANIKTAAWIDYPSAAIRIDNPYSKITDKELESFISPHYDKVLVSTPAQYTAIPLETTPHLSQSVRGFKQFQHLWRGNSYANSKKTEQQEAFLTLVQNLQACGWETIDVYNKSLIAHSDLIVKNSILNQGGHGIVSHFLDTLSESSAASQTHAHQQVHILDNDDNEA